MIVKCTDCNSSYAVDDSKVTNKKFGFICPKCNKSVIIDNRKADESLSMVSESSDFGLQDEKKDFFPGAAPDRKSAGTGTGITLPEEDDLMKMLDEGDDSVEAGSTVKSGERKLDDVDLSDLDLKGGTVKEPEEEPLSLDDFDLSDELRDAGISMEKGGNKKTPPETDLMDGPRISDDEFRPLEEDLMTDDLIVDESLMSGQDLDEMSRKSEKKQSAGISDGSAGGMKVDSVFSKGSKEEEIDESITIDLDSLDIQLDEESAAPVQKVPDEQTEFNGIDVGAVKATGRGDDEDLDITIDLDSLDLPLEEEEGFKKGEVVDEDERLTIADAGLTLDELDKKAVTSNKETPDGESDDDIRLSIDDIEPGMTVDDLAQTDSKEELFISDDFKTDELPEMDMEKFTGEKDTKAVGFVKQTAGPGEAKVSNLKPEGESPVKKQKKESKDFLDIETKEEQDRPDIDELKPVKIPADNVEGGVINFSVDYSLKYSRLGAILRVLGLYYITLIPHTRTVYIRTSFINCRIFKLAYNPVHGTIAR
jgi:hypothetical protein